MDEGKPGYKTTEFWVSVITGVTGLLVVTGTLNLEQSTAIGEAAQSISGAVIAVASAFGYAISRGLAKV